MAKQAFVATYRITETEVFQVSIPIMNDNPTAIYQAKTVAVETIREMHHNAVVQELATEQVKSDD